MTRTIWIERDGERRDITEGVQILYDLCLSSMDFGSGFLDAEEIISIADLAQACGFDDAAPRNYLKSNFKTEGYYSYRIDDTYFMAQASKAKRWLESHKEAS